MSRIYFHSVEGDAEVHGSERAHFGVFCSELTSALLGKHAEEYGSKSILRNLFPENHWVNRSDNFKEAVLLALGGDQAIQLNSKKLESFVLQLNTALSMGSDYVKLAARIHGQCEIHAYVEGKNRAWLAEIIKQGRQSGFYRDQQGWEEVIALLEKSDSPVVTSYSVCERFPNGHVANYEYPFVDGEEDWDAWHDLPYEKQWELGITGLRKSNKGLELRPDDWNTFYFGDGVNTNILIAELLKLPTAECDK